MGKNVDMELLAQKNELTPAIGNAKVNARGDELGPGGRIVRKREEIMAEYYDTNPHAVKDEQYIRKPKPVEEKPQVTNVSTTSRRSTVKKEDTNDVKENTTDS